MGPLSTVGTSEMKRNSIALIHKYNKNTRKKSDTAYKRDRKIVLGKKTF